MVSLNLLYLKGRPWAVTPEIAELGAQLLGSESLRSVAEFHQAMRAAGGDPSAGPVAGAAGERRNGAVAILPVLGLLTQRGQVVNSVKTTSTAELASVVAQAAADERIQSIVLEFDSPGGEVIGTQEAATVIREARGRKPIVAVANGIAGSAAYWLASQASELLVTPSGQVGSIGVYGLHEDLSGELAAKGRKVSLISAGKFKAEGNPYEPLSDEGRMARQAEVNRYYEMFAHAVAKGRRTTVDAVRGGFGEGRMVGARAAVEQGMADAVGTLEDAVRRAMALGAERSRSMAALAAAQVTRSRLGL